MGLLALALGASGCGIAAYFVRDIPTPVPALEVRMDPHARRECLVIFMPGMLDGPDTFVRWGFLDDARRASTRCDLVAVDAHFGYYRSGLVRRRVTEDIIRVGEARGYREFWIVGISMGGLGTMMVAHENSSRVRGAVLLAPFLGDNALLEDIEQAGGLAAWDAPQGLDPEDESDFQAALWSWMQGYAAHPEEMPELYVGVGTEDEDMRIGVHLLDAVLPEDRVGRTPGGHGWPVWRVLWNRLLESPPWDPRDHPPNIRVSHTVGGPPPR